MWTKAHSEHQTSTKSTSCVDRRLLFPLRIHKRYPFCGQKPSPGTKLPQKCTSCVDRRLLFPLRVHKRYPFCGQKSPPDTGLPQKCPRLWTKVPSRHRTSTKMPPPVDKSPLPAPNFHKNAPACGQKSPPGTKLPQKAPYAWTGGNYFFPETQPGVLPETQPGVRLLVGKRESRTTSSSLSTLLSCLLVAL